MTGNKAGNRLKLKLGRLEHLAIPHLFLLQNRNGVLQLEFHLRKRKKVTPCKVWRVGRVGAHWCQPFSKSQKDENIHRGKIGTIIYPWAIFKVSELSGGAWYIKFKQKIGRISVAKFLPLIHWYPVQLFNKFFMCLRENWKDWVWDTFERTPAMSTFSIGIVISEFNCLSYNISDENGE